jgi:Na+-translocating ferredoxin:NAD+ oxidoreductase subunit C
MTSAENFNPPAEQLIASPVWGIRFTSPGMTDSTLPLKTLPLPSQLIVPLNQHIGKAATPLVTVGAAVLRGQPIAAVPRGSLGATVHAPAAGRISKIAAHAVPGRKAALCVWIETDPADQLWPGYNVPADPSAAATSELRAAVAAAGIVGLGGATFPSFYKLNRGNGIKLLIINGVECEPYINCDVALMRDRAASILSGAQLMLRILDAPACSIAIKADAGVALQAMRAALAVLQDERIRIALIPPVYPAGGEAQLVQLLTGQEIPAGGLPADLGIVCNNVATAAAISHFLHTGEPLISRIVTVTGAGIASPVNIEARIGTPISELVSAAGGYTSDAVRIVMGGPMMGVPLATDELPVTKACNCIYVEPAAAFNKTAEMPCIRCGECAIVCPVRLTPQLLLQAQRNSDFEKLQQLGLSECIECGCCDYVCPSHIPLTGKFVSAKHTQWDIRFEQRRARAAESNFRAREARLYRRAQARQQELNAQTDQLTADPADAKAALQALLERAVDKPRDGDS